MRSECWPRAHPRGASALPVSAYPQKATGSELEATFCNLETSDRAADKGKAGSVGRSTEDVGSYARALAEREVLHLSSHTGLIQVLPGHPLADPKR